MSDTDHTLTFTDVEKVVGETKVETTLPEGSLRLTVDPKYQDALNARLETYGVTNIRFHEKDGKSSVLIMGTNKNNILNVRNAGFDLPEETIQYHAPLPIEFFVKNTRLNFNHTLRGEVAIGFETSDRENEMAGNEKLSDFLARLGVEGAYHAQIGKVSRGYSEKYVMKGADNMRKLYVAGIELPEKILKAVGIDTQQRAVV